MKENVTPPQTPLDAETAEILLGRGVTVRMTVTGSSMGHTIRSGDRVTVRPVNGAMVATGDLVFFRTREGLLRLHRVIGRKILAGGETRLWTKGDARITGDEPVRPDDVLGIVVTIEYSADPRRQRIRSLTGIRGRLSGKLEAARERWRVRLARLFGNCRKIP